MIVKFELKDAQRYFGDIGGPYWWEDDGDARLLMEAAAEPKWGNSLGRTPIHWNNPEDFLQYLRHHGFASRVWRDIEMKKECKDKWRADRI